MNYLSKCYSMPNLNIIDDTSDYVRMNLLRMESYRLETFRNWPKYVTPIWTHDMATSGFFYLGPGCRIQCIFCLGIFVLHQSVEYIDICHKRYFPKCMFARGFQAGNIPSLPTKSQRAYERMPPHLIRALEFEPQEMHML